MRSYRGAIVEKRRRTYSRLLSGEENRLSHFTSIQLLAYSTTMAPFIIAVCGVQV
jgi:hypothetical protein